MSTPDLSLSRIATPPLDIRPPLRAETGTVSVLLRNGAPVAVIRPGRSYRRLIGGLPSFGQLKRIVVSTEEIRVAASIQNIRLAGTFPLQSVELKVGLTVSQLDEFAGLTAYIARHGANFAELLNDDVRTELNQIVRDRVGLYTAESVHESRAGLQPDDYHGASLLGGLFEITKIAFAEPVFPAEFAQLQKVALEGQVTEAEIREKLRLAPATALLDETEDALLEAKAIRRGLTLRELESPELADAREQREHEAVQAREERIHQQQMGLIAQLDELRRAGGSELVSQILSGGLGGLGAGSAEIPSGGAAGRADGAAEGGRGGGLFTDPELAGVWKDEGLPGRPLGIAQVDDEAVAVLAESVTDEQATSIRDTLRSTVGAERTYVLGGVTNEQEVVERYLRARLPLLVASLRTVDVALRDGHLTINLVARGDEPLRPLVKALNDPHSSVLSPLTEVLAAATVEIVTADRP